MPLYEYICEDCGPFAAMRPLAEFAAPFACPDCGTQSPRNLLASPALGGNPAPGGASPGAKAHASACACCRPARGGLRADAVGG